MTLPLFINRNNRISMALLCGFAFLIGYSLPNKFHLFPPQQLPLSSLDLAIPFIPWFIFIYMSEYFLFVFAYFQIEQEINRNRYIWAYFGVLFFGMFVFLLFPTVYPRGDYPLPADLNPIVHATFSLLRTLDDPSCCLPSMHVACCYLTAFAFWSKGESKIKFWFYFVWSTLVAISTLPTKQHYIVDVLAGLVLSYASYWLFFKQVQYISKEEFLGRLRSRLKPFKLP